MFQKSKPTAAVSITFERINQSFPHYIFFLFLRWSYISGSVWEPVDCRPWCAEELPSTPEKATVIHSGTLSDEDHSLGQVVTYTCDDGYEFTDTETGIVMIFIGSS